MRCFRLWAALLSLVAPLLAGLSYAETQSLPSCAQFCIADLLPKSSCVSTNQTCICTNAPLNKELTACVSANCTLKESLTAVNITDTTCGLPIRDQTSLSILVPAVGMSIFIVLIILRMITRLVVAKLEVGLDDWATILLGCLAVPVNTDSILLGKAGLGRDIWTLKFDNITRILYLFYIQELLYITCVSLVKIGFLLFYLRIFPTDRIRRIIKISCIVTVCYWLGFLFAFAFQCSPVRYNWTMWDGEHQGTCVNTNAMVVTAAALNIVLDVWIIALPIPKVLKLQASITTKIQVLLMFSIGFLITGVGIYRAVMLKLFATSTNPTWDNAPGGYWSVIEIDVGIFCLCMPALRSLLGRLFPSIFGTTKGASRVGQSSNQKRVQTAGTSSGPNTSFVQLIEMDDMDKVESHSHN
ncbi:hypothetical protein N7516_003640 [Penicillium verrucosum]|uniref:uncharacterized protein n=1 Tax=Penicillium verrucosum TaxID=60171 RepID=UPI0025451EEA|nr:uncharacterized protein N7516_003640 [Penicillium verrucosum]KAJ5943472.1 hypothetical protein N7516_003640 [Penicillium verrucosum]